jgi:hypothetical protein
VQYRLLTTIWGRGSILTQQLATNAALVAETVAVMPKVAFCMAISQTAFADVLVAILLHHVVILGLAVQYRTAPVDSTICSVEQIHVFRYRRDMGIGAE